MFLKLLVTVSAIFEAGFHFVGEENGPATAARGCGGGGEQQQQQQQDGRC